MASFPVSHSILSAASLGRLLQDRYGLSGETSCSLIKAGINHSYLVSDKSDLYVFRVYSLHWRTEKEIREEINLLIYLRQVQLPVSYPLPDVHGQYIQFIDAPEGERLAVLFTHAPGEKLHSVGLDLHFKIGQLMAHFHTATINRRLERTDYDPNVLLQEPIHQISAFLGSNTDEWRYLLSLQHKLLQQWEQAKRDEIRKGIVHLDIWFDNLNISADHTITLFDFDFCGNGWQVLDVAYYIMQLHNVEKYEAALYEPKVERFLKGYESVTQLTAEEKRLLPALGLSLYFFYLGVQCSRYENWSNSFLNESYLKRFINGLVRRYAAIGNVSV